MHLFAGLFAVSFSGVVATVFRSKLTGMLVSVSILGTLVGIAFLGFYYPDYRTVSYFNPFFDGVVPIGNIGHLGLLDVLSPMVLLIGFNIALWLIGRHSAVRLLRGE